MPRRIDRSAVLMGLLFIAIGLLYELDSLEILAIQASYIWPLVLIGLGLAVLLGGGRRRRRFPPIDAFQTSESDRAGRADEPWGPDQLPQASPADDHSSVERESDGHKGENK